MHSALGAGHLVAGRYRLIDELGRGAMGIVWRGRDELLDRDVAIKQIVGAPTATATQARVSFQRTLREARTAARLSHPGVVTVFDVVEEDGSPWIIMELVRARPLDQVVAEDGPLPPARAAQLGLGLLDALTTAHQAGVLHRDVKPSNVLISPNGKAILTDFGIATIQGDPGLTQAGMVVGTPGFSPPERVRGAPATTASDLWSLGATLYAAVEGRGPFDRAGGSAAIIASIATEPAPRAPSAGPLGQVIEALLRADPAERPDSPATARMLTQAWKSARSTCRESILASQLPAGLASDARKVQAPAASLEATTATQVVAVPPDLESSVSADREFSLAGAQSGEPGPVSGLLPHAAEGAAPAGVTSAGSLAATGVVPDLMATPNFADLKMPAATMMADAPASTGNIGPATPETPLGPCTMPDATPDTMPGTMPARRRRGAGAIISSRIIRSRRVVLFAAPVLLAAVIAAVVFLGPDGITDQLGIGGGGTSQDHLASGHAGARSGSHHTGHRPAGHPASGSGPSAQPATGTSSKPGKPGTSGRTSTSPKASASGQPSAPGKPSPSASGPATSPSPTPQPTASSPPASGGAAPPPPPGYVWDRVPAKKAGTIAGFRLAGPSGWLMTPALKTIIKPQSGPGRLTVNMSGWAVTGPVKQAKRLQANAIAAGTYPRYHRVALTGTKFHGWPAARWTFTWLAPKATHRTDVTELFFTVQTYAGPQQYVLSISAPAPKSSWADSIFTVAKQTFRALPPP
ncbi:MAG TPA: protein kinase [Streptosporangiaceae bacterium]|nr:protein kinase [Streptosporangiaceae bacterium]